MCSMQVAALIEVAPSLEMSHPILVQCPERKELAHGWPPSVNLMQPCWAGVLTTQHPLHPCHPCLQHPLCSGLCSFLPAMWLWYGRFLFVKSLVPSALRCAQPPACHVAVAGQVPAHKCLVGEVPRAGGLSCVPG